MNPIVNITDANFEHQVEERSGRILVLFKKKNCLPCKTIVPLFNTLHKINGDSYDFGVVDSATDPEHATELVGNSYPTIILFDKGKVAFRMVGGPVDFAGLANQIGSYMDAYEKRLKHDAAVAAAK